MTFTVQGVTARKPHRCNLCNRAAIVPGHRYLRRVQFPDGRVNQTLRPWVARWCLACAVARCEEVGAEVDDPIDRLGACGRFCHGVTPCALDGDHTGEHSCRQDALAALQVERVPCDTEWEPDGGRCPGVILYQPDDVQAACSTCGAWRGRRTP